MFEKAEMGCFPALALGIEAPLLMRFACTGSGRHDTKGRTSWPASPDLPFQKRDIYMHRQRQPSQIVFQGEGRGRKGRSAPHFVFYIPFTAEPLPLWLGRFV